MRRTAVAFVLVVGLGLLGCPKKAPPKPPPLPPDPKEELLAAIKKLYTALEKQEPERLEKVLAPDCFVYGLGPKDTYLNRETLIESARTDLIPFGLRGDVFKVASSSPKVALSDAQESGWFYDLPKLEQVRSGKPSRLWKLRLTGHANREKEGEKIRWRFDALHASFAWPDAELYAPDAAKNLRLPEPVGVDKGLDSDQMIGLTKRILDDVAVKIDRTSEAPETVLIGTDPGDIFEGGAKFKEVARPRLPELKKAFFILKIEDGPRARLAPDRKSGWVAATVVLKVGKPPKQQLLPPFRALWIFREEKEVWNLVSEHQSLALPPELRKPVADGDEPPATPGPSDAGHPADAGR